MYDGAPTIHKHYDAEGNLVGHTEIVSPWDDEARAEAEALWEAEKMICPMCGNLRDECSDPDQLWFPQRHVCYASRAQAGADSRFRMKNEGTPFQSWDGRTKSKKQTAAAPFSFHDGVRVWVSQHDLTPEDHFI